MANVDEKVTAEQHYNWAMNLLGLLEEKELEDGIDPLTAISKRLEALTHAILAGTRDGLDYTANQAARAKAVYEDPDFEEDDTRP